MRHLLFFWTVTAAVAIAAGIGAVYLVDLAAGQIVVAVALLVFLMGLAIRFRPERELPIFSDPLVLFLVFQTQFFVVAPLSVPLFDSFIYYPITVERILAVVGAAFLMVAMFVLAYQMRLGAVLAGMLPDFSGGRLKLPGWLFEILVIAFGVIGSTIYVAGLGGLDFFFRLGYGTLKSSSFYLIPVQALILGTLLLGWRLIVTRPIRLLSLLLFTALILFELFFFGILLGSRKRFFYLFFGLLTLWQLGRGRTLRLPRYAAVAVMMALMAFFSVWGVVRHMPLRDILAGKMSTAISGTSGERGDPIRRGYLFSVTEPFGIACMVMDIFPEQEPYRHGRTLLVTLLGFIPREVWPDKPVGLAKELTRYTDGAYYQPRFGHSVTPTLVGDFYVNMGFLGVALGGFLYGLGCRVVASYCARGIQNGVQTNSARALVTAVFMAGLPEVREDTASLLAFYAITYPFLLFGLLFFRFQAATPTRDALPESPAGEAGLPVVQPVV